MARWRFYTGITGILGQYLLIEALRRREPVAVLVRGRRGVDGSDRVDRMIASWEARLGKVLPRPVVLQGDLRRKGLGLSEADRRWFRHRISSVVHSAASVRFQESQGEPMLSNVNGTQNLLDLCRRSSVQDFHFISTAYSCGKVKAPTVVMESMHDCERLFLNVYEKSKCIAERVVQEAQGCFTRTIHRPSIIIGEVNSGFVPGFNSLYTLAQYAWIALRNRSIAIRSINDLMQLLDIPQHGTKNLVPVDWLAHSIRAIVQTSHYHGRIYHLTNPKPTSNLQIGHALAAALSISVDGNRSDALTEDQIRSEVEGFRQQSEALTRYSEPDPTFDRSAFATVAGRPECPDIGVEELTRTLSFAVKIRFRTELPELTDEHREPRRTFEKVLADVRGSKFTHFKSERRHDRANEQRDQGSHTHSHFATAILRLILTGPGGGEWRVRVDSTEVSVARPGKEQKSQVTLYSSAQAFRSWMGQQMTFEDGVRMGAFVVLGQSPDLERISEIMERFRRFNDQCGQWRDTQAEAACMESPSNITTPETVKC